MWQWFVKNWKTNVLATVAIVYSATQFVTAVQAWEAGQPANWKAAFISLIVAAVGYAAKDAGNVPTQTEVNIATQKAKNGQ
jgi:hypothetical protein